MYTVWVRAYTTKILYNQSRPLKFKTPSESRIDSHIQNSVGEPNVPQNLMVILVAALALFIMMNIGWIILGFIYGECVENKYVLWEISVSFPHFSL